MIKPLAAVAGTLSAIIVQNAVGISQQEVDALVGVVCGLVTALTVLILHIASKPPNKQ